MKKLGMGKKNGGGRNGFSRGDGQSRKPLSVDLRVSFFSQGHNTCGGSTSSRSSAVLPLSDGRKQESGAFAPQTFLPVKLQTFSPVGVREKALVQEQIPQAMDFFQSDNQKKERLPVFVIDPVPAEKETLFCEETGEVMTMVVDYSQNKGKCKGFFDLSHFHDYLQDNPLSSGEHKQFYITQGGQSYSVLATQEKGENKLTLLFINTATQNSIVQCFEDEIFSETYKLLFMCPVTTYTEDDSGKYEKDGKKYRSEIRQAKLQTDYFSCKQNALSALDFLCRHMEEYPEELFGNYVPKHQETFHFDPEKTSFFDSKKQIARSTYLSTQRTLNSREVTVVKYPKEFIVLADNPVSKKQLEAEAVYISGDQDEVEQQSVNHTVGLTRF